MKGFENLNQEVAKDLIELVNSMTGFEKTKSVHYQTKSGIKEFNYVPLDNILSKIKENNNFALMQPIGTDGDGKTGVKCVLIHKSGHVIESDTYPFRLIENAKFQDEGTKKHGEWVKTQGVGAKLQDEGTEITYRKRYALGSFLGMSTEEDDDGNDDQAINVTERKATPKQIDVLLKYYNGDLLDKLLESNNIKKIEDINFKKASELIGTIINKGVNK